MKKLWFYLGRLIWAIVVFPLIGICLIPVYAFSPRLYAKYLYARAKSHAKYLTKEEFYDLVNIPPDIKVAIKDYENKKLRGRISR